MDFFDILLAKQLEGGGGGDVTIEQLSVTENGTYTAPEGKAYTPVVVNVSGYKIKDIPNTPTAIATFNASALPMPSLKVGIEPQQEGSGDPSPENIRPISGWDEVNVTRCGKNLCGELEEGSLSESKPIGSTYSELKYSVANRMRIETLVPTFGNDIVVTCNSDTYDFCCALFDTNGMYLGRNKGFESWRDTPYTPSIPSGYIAVALKRKDNQDILSFDYENCHLQIELGETATAYEPYNGHTYTIDLDGTRYGGTLDVVSGVLTVDWLKLDISQISITKSVSGLFQTNSLTADIKKPISTLSASGYIKSSLFSEIGSTYITGPQGTNPSPDGVMALSSSGMLYFNYLATSDIDVFKRAMENVEFVYKLATPQTYQLTPTAVKSLLGSNNVWADTGDVLEGSYFKEL